MSAAGMVIIEVMYMVKLKTKIVRHTHKLNDVCTARMIIVHNVTDRVELKYIHNSHTNHELGVSKHKNLSFSTL